MTYQGHVECGKVVLDEPALLEEGVCVRIEVLSGRHAQQRDPVPSLAKRLAPIIGKAKSLPPDAAENHDHYLYGTPKQ